MDFWSENVQSQHVCRGKLEALSWSKRLPNIGLEVLNHDYLIWTIFDVNCIDGLHEVIVDFQGLLVSTELLEKTPPVITREQGSKKPEAPEELGGKI